MVIYVKKVKPGDALVLFVVLAIGVTVAIWAGLLRFDGAQAEDVPMSKVRDELMALEVSGWVDAPPYERAEFGEPWADVDMNGCDTRNDILARDMERVVFRSNSRCVVAAGILNDPYTGRELYFERGDKTSPLVQIDHVVPLSNAWFAGAWQWDVAKREQFANDPQNLLAVDGPANEDKANLTADKWLPENSDYHCAYVARQVHVKYVWGLSVKEKERQAMIDVLSKCPVVEVPTR